MDIKIKRRDSCPNMDEKPDECEKFRNFPICALEYDPVCGSDGLTYGNKCGFCLEKEKNADLRIVSAGQCPEIKV